MSIILLKRRSRMLFHWRAQDLSLTALTGQVGVFSRASAARAVDSNGYLYNQVTNQESWHYESGTPYLLLRGAATNLVTSDNFDSGWTSVDSPTITASIDDPARGTSAYTIADASAGAVQGKSFTPTFTGNAVKCVVWCIRKRTFPTEGHVLQMRQTSGTPANKILATVSAWGSGAPTVTMTTGTLLCSPFLVDDYWVIPIQSTSVTAAETNVIYAYPTSSTVTEQGAFDIYRVNAYDAPYPPRVMLNASAALAASNLYFPISFKPGVGYTLYAKFLGFMDANVGVVGFGFSIGDTGSAGAAISVRARSNIDAWTVTSRTTAGGAVTADVAGGDIPAVASSYEWRMSIPASGDLTWGVSTNGATETTNTLTPGTWDATWNTPRIYFGSGAGANQGNIAMHSFKIAPAAGISMATMRTLF